MINLDLIREQNNLFLIRFSEPDETFLHKPYIAVYGEEEVIKRFYFKNKRYIYETLISWLNQRKYANTGYLSTITNLEFSLINLKEESIFRICEYIANNKARFQMIAPPDGSRMRKHFESKILPIIQFVPENKEALIKIFNGNKLQFFETEG